MSVELSGSEPVVIYSRPNCSYCDKAFTFLERNHIPYKSIKLDPEEQSDKYCMYTSHLKERTGQKTFPFIFVDNKFIGGYDDMIVSFQTGQLGEILKKYNIIIINDF